MFMNDKERFLDELATYMRNVKKLSESAIKTYLNRIKRLLDSGYSVNDLCGAADRLWADYGAKGQRYDPKDHGNTRAAIKQVARLVREKILEEYGCPYVSYSVGWSSSRPTGKYEAGYIIDNGEITFLYNIGFETGKSVVKELSATNISKLHYIFETAYKHGCLAPSNTCLTTAHGAQHKYGYSYKDASGSDCCCLFKGDSADVTALRNEFEDLIRDLRA